MNNGSIHYTQRRRQRPRRPSRLTRNVTTTTLIAIAVICGIIILAQNRTSWISPLPQGIGASCLTHVDIPDDVNEEIIDYTGFTVSFNPTHHQPNYTAWELTGQEAEGSIPRSSKFKADNNVYGSATLDDYRGSGYDRGHMAPAGDMKWSQQAMDDSHYLTNVCPQDHVINGGRWSVLEKKCRQWAQRDSAIIIICGPILTDELSTTIGRQVTVPDRFFKVVFAPHANPPRAIAFIVPNHPTDQGLESMVTSVDNVEAITGFDFFACLPDDIETQIERDSNYRLWNQRKN